MPDRANSVEHEFAKQLQLHADVALDEYGEAADELLRELSAAAAENDDDRALVALAAFLVALEALAETVTLDVALAGLREVDRILSTAVPVRIGSQLTFQQRDLLLAQARALVETARTNARIAANATAESLAVTLQIEMTPGKLKRLRNAYDYAAVSSTHRELRVAGSGIFTSKIAVPVIDNDTTDLCRNRMAYQIRRWDEMYVDPRSGSEWIDPPFVGAKLLRREAWHPCRTISVPRR